MRRIAPMSLLGGTVFVLGLIALVASRSGGLWQEDETFHKGAALGVFDIGPAPRFMPYQNALPREE